MTSHPATGNPEPLASRHIQGPQIGVENKTGFMPHTFSMRRMEPHQGAWFYLASKELAEEFRPLILLVNWWTVFPMPWKC